jgi:hypothetical protein
MEWRKNVGNFCNFQETTQSKQSPNGRKFAQPGHTGSQQAGADPTTLSYNASALKKFTTQRLA